MLTPERREEQKRELECMLDMSCQVSLNSADTKPFIRFAKQTDRLYGKNVTLLHSSPDWNSYGTLQKILLEMARTVATPHELWQSCTQRSRDALRAFVEK